MGSVNLAMDALSGPRGGDLDKHGSVHRNAPLDAPIVTTKDGDRIIGMHDPREQDTARQGVIAEKGWHRMAAYMLNAGFTNIQVADAAEKSPEMVSILRAQRWFNELCVELARDENVVIKSRLSSYALEAVEAIHAIATDTRVDDDGKPLVAPRVSLDAHRTLLEHSQGKPTQKVLSVSATTSFSSEKEEYESILQELQGLGNVITPQPKA